MKARFGIAAALTVTTGRLLCEVGDLYQILNFMTGDNLMTHQLPRASEAAGPVILAQHPDLIEIEVPYDLSGAEPVAAWVAGLKDRYGADVWLEPMTEWKHINPIIELASMLDADQSVIVVQTAESP